MEPKLVVARSETPTATSTRLQTIETPMEGFRSQLQLGRTFNTPHLSVLLFPALLITNTPFGIQVAIPRSTRLTTKRLTSSQISAMFLQVPDLHATKVLAYYCSFQASLCQTTEHIPLPITTIRLLRSRP